MKLPTPLPPHLKTPVASQEQLDHATITTDGSRLLYHHTQTYNLININDEGLHV